MALRVSKTFGRREASQTVDPHKKHIFVFEGEKTEKQYFEGLFNNRVDLGIKDLISIKTLDRGDGSHSNQRKIVGELHDSLQQVVAIREKKDDFISDLISVLDENDAYNLKEIEKSIREVLEGKEIDPSLSEISSTVSEVTAEYFGINTSELLDELRKLKDLLDYDSGYDTVCIVIDRDKGSFKDFQYDEVISICEENGYQLGITNPCFEFWLLLHFTDCQEFEKRDIENNNKVTKNRTFVNYELKEYLGGYKKNNLKFQMFKPYITQAIENSGLYCTEPIKLKETIGTSVGDIINELLD